MGKLLAVMVALGLILTAVNILVVDHNRSKWGYQVGDYIEYKDVEGTNWTTTRVINIEPNDIVVEQKGLIWGSYSSSIRPIDKYTPFLLSEYYSDPHDKIAYLPDEKVTLPWGTITCHVYTVDSVDNYHYVNWVKNGVLVKGTASGGYINLSNEWHLVDLSPHLRFAYLGL
jgi:hypothetical protein